ncbi:hypothetical protein FHS27_001335 [Rhodopirellula rubra]|uniref:Transmembrane protein n=1 Tax=Aporhodopirellula rubra TaxID=980271 RepID=A0A7W5DW74_9BACT|nr:hypothetical protein [Aporhodopirellula rubra]
MRDCFELVELSLYIVGIALILPVLQIFDGRGSVGAVLFLCLVFPIPFFLARLRVTFPERIDVAFEQLAYWTFFVGLFVMAILCVTAAYRWIASVQ